MASTFYVKEYNIHILCLKRFGNSCGFTALKFSSFLAVMRGLTSFYHHQLHCHHRFRHDHQGRNFLVLVKPAGWVAIIDNHQTHLFLIKPAKSVKFQDVKKHLTDPACVHFDGFKRSHPFIFWEKLHIPLSLNTQHLLWLNSIWQVFSIYGLITGTKKTLSHHLQWLVPMWRSRERREKVLEVENILGGSLISRIRCHRKKLNIWYCF